MCVCGRDATQRILACHQHPLSPPVDMTHAPAHPLPLPPSSSLNQAVRHPGACCLRSQTLITEDVLHMHLSKAGRQACWRTGRRIVTNMREGLRNCHHRAVCSCVRDRLTGVQGWGAD